MPKKPDAGALFSAMAAESKQRYAEVRAGGTQEQPQATSVQKVRVNVTLTPAQHAALKKHAAETGESASSFVRRMIQANLMDE